MQDPEPTGRARPYDPAAPPYPEPDFWPQARLSVGGILADACATYLSGFFKYSLLALLALAPVVVWAVVLLSDLDDLGRGSSLGYQLAAIGLASLLLQPLATGAIIYGVFRRKSGKRASLGGCLAVGVRRLPHLLAVVILTTLAIVAISLPFVILALMPFLGILALTVVVPILMFVTAAYAAAPAVVVERRGPIEAFGRSFKLTRGTRGRIFGVILVLGVVQQAIEWGLEKALLVDVSELGFGSLEAFLDSIRVYLGVQLGLAVLFNAVGAVAAALVFHQLKMQTEGADPAELAAVFD